MISRQQRRPNRRREVLGKMASYVRTEIDPSKLPHAQKYEIADLRLQEQAKDEANSVGDFVSNRIQSIDDLRSNALKMGLYKLAIERFSGRIPAGMIRIFVDAALAGEMSARREQAALKAKLKAASSKNDQSRVSSAA